MAAALAAAVSPRAGALVACDAALRAVDGMADGGALLPLSDGGSDPNPSVRLAVVPRDRAVAMAANCTPAATVRCDDKTKQTQHNTNNTH